MSIVSGLLADTSSPTCASAPSRRSDAAALFLAIGGVVILFTWTENKGDGSENTSVQQGMRQAYEAIKGDRRVFYLGAMQSLFEASMYSFVFLWTPALGPNGEDIPHGMIFATMMVACMVGSSIASRIMSRSDVKVERYMQWVFLASAASLAVPVFVKTLGLGEGVQGGPMTFEEGADARLPRVRGHGRHLLAVHDEDALAIRPGGGAVHGDELLPHFNLFVCVILYNVAMFPLSAMFAMCTLFLLGAAFLQKKLEQLSNERPHGKYVQMTDRA